MDIFSKISEIQFFFPKKLTLRELGLRKNTAARRQTLVHHPGQTIGPTTIKFGMHLLKGHPLGIVFENFRNSYFFPKKEFS